MMTTICPPTALQEIRRCCSLPRILDERAEEAVLIAAEYIQHGDMTTADAILYAAKAREIPVSVVSRHLESAAARLWETYGRWDLDEIRRAVAAQTAEVDNDEYKHSRLLYHFCCDFRCAEDNKDQTAHELWGDGCGDPKRNIAQREDARRICLLIEEMRQRCKWLWMAFGYKDIPPPAE